MKENILTFNDFNLLDAVITTENKIFTIGLKNDDFFITQSKAFSMYKGKQLIQKSIDFEGEKQVLFKIEELEGMRETGNI